MSSIPPVVQGFLAAYGLFVIGCIVLYFAVMFSIIGLYFQARRMNNIMEDNSEYLRRIGYSLNKNPEWTAKG